MFYVDLYDNGMKVIHAPFENKNAAIKYFNYVCDRNNPFLLNCSYAEILDENIVLFDYEV